MSPTISLVLIVTGEAIQGTHLRSGECGFSEGIQGVHFKWRDKVCSLLLLKVLQTGAQGKYDKRREGKKWIMSTL